MTAIKHGDICTYVEVKTVVTPRSWLQLLALLRTAQKNQGFWTNCKRARSVNAVDKYFRMSQYLVLVLYICMRFGLQVLDIESGKSTTYISNNRREIKT
jgi:hypothetical protein